jgi:transcription antitermination factor NusG
MILEVNDDGESLYERYEFLESELIRVFGEETQFFIPAYIEKVKDKVIGIDLIGGYLFVEKTVSSDSAVAGMSSPYIKGRMSEGAKSCTMTGASINNYKRKLLESIKNLAPKKGAVVVPKVGTFKSLEGKVISVARDRKSARVLFKKSSRIVQAPVSVLNMEPAPDPLGSA